MPQLKHFLVALSSLAPTIACANLLSNGSFELGNFNNTDPDPRPEIMLIPQGATNITGWTIQGSGGVHWVLDAIIASTGTYYLDLQGELANPLSSISTSFATTVGGLYRLSFDTFPGTQGALNTGTVSAGSLQNQAFTGNVVPGPATHSSYTPLQYNFIATSITPTLTFRVTGTNGFGPVIDNVVVTEVPEPHTAAMFLLGLAALALRRRASDA